MFFIAPNCYNHLSKSNSKVNRIQRDPIFICIIIRNFSILSEKNYLATKLSFGYNLNSLPNGKKRLFKIFLDTLLAVHINSCSLSPSLSLSHAHTQTHTHTHTQKKNLFSRKRKCYPSLPTITSDEDLTQALILEGSGQHSNKHTNYKSTYNVYKKPRESCFCYETYTEYSVSMRSPV